MSSNTFTQMPYLRTSRTFPQESQPLSVEMSKSYIDIANYVNSRIIGFFPANNPAVTGESWFFTSAKQQSQRQVYTFTGAGSIPHGIQIPSLYAVSRVYGSYTDGTNYYGLIFGSNIDIAGQVIVYLTPTNIVISADAGAPSITSGIVVVEWITNP